MNKILDIIYLTEYLTDDDILTLWSQDRVTDEDIKYIRAGSAVGEKDNWIKVSDKLPEYKARAGSDNFVHVFACFNGLTSQAMYCNGKWDAMGIHGITPTHWQPLPEPPPAKSNNDKEV